MSYRVNSIGEVRKSHDGISIVIFEPYRPAMKELDKFSHIIVIWWISGNDNERARKNLQDVPPFETAPMTGVFASRSPARPNPIGITVVQATRIDMHSGVIKIKRIDAFDKSPILDLKGYFPPSDRVKDPQWPDFYKSLPEWYPDI
ncbi:MAG: tRNA (N6-threonylcarbamoyladenosine(37)-N6)-methyltransferase TrmO [Candidatus Heimdallarchaeota archaeon]|nr:tRNA (N6-threonylcarbamoyladenosine(37)-N6)-methyltransferase TrmO [Candidatus Heimdallarchaeota archaeon]